MTFKPGDKVVCNEIRKIEVDNDGHITFWFFGSEEPWDVTEFETGSETRKYLEEIVDLILSKGLTVQEEVNITKFKTGDEVKCIDDKGVTTYVTKDNVYVIKGFCEDHWVHLHGVKKAILAERFVLAKEANPHVGSTFENFIEKEEEETKQEHSQYVNSVITQGISELKEESLNEIYDGIIAQGQEELEEERLKITPEEIEELSFVRTVHSLIPECLTPKRRFYGTRVKEVVTMALKWQSEQPHVGECKKGQLSWRVGSRSRAPGDNLYHNEIRVGALDSVYAQNILDVLNAAEEKEPGPYCPTCKAQAELKERE